jgi:XTP/dITP diphosphohydrolase
MDILISSRNRDKIREIKTLLSSLPFSVFTPYDFDDLPDVEEDKNTLLGNALKKGRELTEITGLPTIADDTGLFIDALAGEPGIYAARYAGEHCSYADNRHKVLRLMANKIDRSARFMTVAVFVRPGAEPLVAEGIVEGEITEEERGDKGFGYDNIFRLREGRKTFAEMEEEEKNLFSHRGIAFRKLAAKIQEAYEAGSLVNDIDKHKMEEQ